MATSALNSFLPARKSFIVFLAFLFLLDVRVVWAADPPSGVCPQPRNTRPVPKKFRTLKNPLKATPENIANGKNLYHFMVKPTPCKNCHGEIGDGMGLMSWALAPLPRNFVCKTTMKSVSDGQMFGVIKNGARGSACLPNRGLKDEQIWQLILYIKQFVK
jgi:hypothetical protein